MISFLVNTLAVLIIIMFGVGVIAQSYFSQQAEYNQQ